MADGGGKGGAAGEGEGGEVMGGDGKQEQRRSVWLVMIV